LLHNQLPIVSLDDLRREMGVAHSDSTGQGHVIQRAQELAKRYAAAQQSFVWNATNLTADLRSKIIGLLSVYNPFFKITYLETSRENVFTRRKEDIPRAALEKMFRILDMPLAVEGQVLVGAALLVLVRRGAPALADAVAERRGGYRRGS